MFERFFDSVSVMRIASQGDTQKLKKLINAGCRLDRRTSLQPWMTPLDAAVASGHLDCVETLISGGAPIIGSAIYEAVVRDSKEVLDIFFRSDNNFHHKFHIDSGGPNHWPAEFTALDLAISFGSQRCAEFLVKNGAPQHKHIMVCSPLQPVKDASGKVQLPLAGEKWQFYRQRCFAILIESDEFVTKRGTNTDGRSMVTTGYYCAKCKRYLKM